MQEQVAVLSKKKFTKYLDGDSSLLIDLVRVVACEMVVVCHVFNIYDNHFHKVFDNSNIFYEINIFLGVVGVILFFIVSGIVISNSLLRNLDSNKDYSFVNFFVDRFSRIYAGLVPCLFFVVICDIVLSAINPGYFTNMDIFVLNATTVLGSLFMIQNMFPLNITTPAYAGTLWTLNIEWWLYLTFGWIVVNMKKGIKSGMLSLIPFIIPLLVFVYIPAETLLVGSAENLVIVWCIGVAATLLYVYFDRSRWDNRLDYAMYFAAILVVGRLAYIYYSNSSYFDLTLEILLSICIILLMLKYKGQNRFDNIKFKSIIKFMGRYSFTLYLVHFVIENTIFGLYLSLELNFSLVILFAFSIILSNIIAIMIAYPTEMQYKKLSRFLNSKINGTIIR
ncbi:MAG TPA: acyltransferase [Methanocella sp.]|nr:acyltransferase [Methanocella sp.]